MTNSYFTPGIHLLYSQNNFNYLKYLYCVTQHDEFSHLGTGTVWRFDYFSHPLNSATEI